jgi:hypothetical protein
LVKSKIYTQNPNLDPNKPAMQVVSRMARDMGDKLTDVFPSARAGELPKDLPQAAKPIEPPKTSFSAAEIAKLPPVERFGHILPGVNRNKQGGLNLQDLIGKKPYALPDGRVITDPTILRDIYKIQQQELANTKAAAPKQPQDDSFLSKAGRVLGGELASDVFAPKPVAPKTEPVKTVPPEAALDPGERIVSPDELKPPKQEKPVATKAEKGLSDFERAFAAARKEQGAKGEFSYTDPKTGKTGTFSTAYRDEKPTAVAQADKEVFESINTTRTTELQDILRLAGRK